VNDNHDNQCNEHNQIENEYTNNLNPSKDRSLNVSDCDSRNTDVKLLAYELNEDFTKSLDNEIDRLKMIWYEGTVMEQ